MGDSVVLGKLARVHVVLVVPGGVDRSGEERVIPALLWLIERLASRHEVTVVALGQERDDAMWPLRGATVVNVRPAGAGPRALAGLLRRAVAAAGCRGQPDVVHGFWASVSGLAGVLAGARYRAPSIVSAAGGEILAMPEIGYGGALGRGGRLIGSTALKRATAVTVSSGWMAEHVRSSGFRVDEVVALGVDRTVFGVPCDPSVRRAHHLVHVASRNRVKDPFTLVSAFAEVVRRVPDATLEMIGVDTLDGAVERHAASLGLIANQGPLTVTPYVAWHSLAPHYHRASLHVLSSLHDAAPVVVLEAASCGLPTVGTRVGHVTDLAELARPAALAVPTGSPSALADAVVGLLHDERRRSALASSAQAWAAEHDADHTAERFEALYGRLTAVSRPSRRVRS